MNERRPIGATPHAHSEGEGIIPEGEVAVDERCDHCGSSQLTWRKCKLICDACRQISKSCADL